MAFACLTRPIGAKYFCRAFSFRPMPRLLYRDHKHHIQRNTIVCLWPALIVAPTVLISDAAHSRWPYHQPHLKNNARKIVKTADDGVAMTYIFSQKTLVRIIAPCQEDMSPIRILVTYLRKSTNTSALPIIFDISTLAS